MASAKPRVYILTGAVAAITATGAWYGAGLKTRHEFKQERQTITQATTSDRIASLEMSKAKLLKQRTEMQNKIDQLTGKATTPPVEKIGPGR
ncbi:hypothetical protein CLAFUW4_02168 [Fulvia fulva]|uniref:Uncharacterized protein n=1 Tax=Passalora fulva TaxID=5499 RepID=A0A9Q8LA99_PASFU|nr:uncharacterized protein CLAFUR5_02159 [Fulvia fulva]KAK4636265.1 hypothetical protein CLAFUR4_02164 [Fulvia fulva]KAK4638031.1 hypothetical protein CLAFUR0_02167 [Fulvia fulva]UJO13058.1 hypothetical protein CLAFUR5_02159 [Fulvia fulva]WPV10016.1 hypothetical protein CLAFUW4_02168 [Fulvia fulva]WPV23512.1 hypothetical protein CLAFUW7_02168 [Fulvia fulva]